MSRLASQGPFNVELDSLPPEWTTTCLRDLAEIGQKSRPPTQANPIPFVPMSLIPSNTLYLTDYEMKPLDQVRSGVWFQEGDLLLAKITPCLENGKQVIAKDVPGGRGMATTEVFPIQCRDVLTEYLAFYLKLPQIRRLLASKMEGTTGRQRLPKPVLENLEIPLPPLAEQHAISNALQAVQQAREATERVLAAARELKRSLMRHLFTYGPVPVQQAEQVQLRDMTHGTVPAEWQTARLDQCAYVQTGAAKGRRFSNGNTIEVPYLRVANVQDGYLDLSEIKQIQIAESELERYRLHSGDVVVTEGGDFDKLGRGFIWQGQIQNCIHQNHIFAVRTKRAVLLPQYLAFLIQSDYGKAYFLNVAHRTTHLACINSSKLKAFPVLLPTLAEQQEIANILSAVDRKIAAEEARYAALDTLFNSILQQLMTGRVRLASTL